MIQKKIVKKIFERFGLRLTKIDYSDTILTNVFDRQYKKKVLLSFVKEPFMAKISFRHSIYLECYSAAKIFDERKYQVDVIEYSSDQPYDINQYDVIYGFGEPLEKSFYFDTETDVIRISYLNGCNPSYSNLVSALRLKRFYKQKGILLPSSSRLLQRNWKLQTLLSNILIVLGNSFVTDTYLREDNTLNIHKLNAFFFDVFNIDLSQKDFDVSRRHFLWFGSSGAIHKGLDLLIDIFSNRSDIFLHICGVSSYEKKFLDFYKDAFKEQNIVNHGFVDISSCDFQELMYTCGAVLFPSASEGGAASILNVIANGGLIPIISKSAGLDLENVGIMLEQCTVEEIEEKINKFTKLPKTSIKEMSFAAKEHVRENYSYDKYFDGLRQLLNNAFE